ncbi:hypothetical protein KODAMA_01800 [Serratia phage vB_SmaM-Kodama]|nr:hypothetical protein KODAMA_01800 [Serratia phage vB_SmaM-Kodama]
MKPIEPGCMAVIISQTKEEDRNEVGKVVRVVGLVPDGESLYSLEGVTTCTGESIKSTGAFIPDVRSWVVLGDIVVAKLTTDKYGTIYAKGEITIGGFTGNGMVAEHRLMRIDGFEDEDKAKEKDLLLTE